MRDTRQMPSRAHWARWASQVRFQPKSRPKPKRKEKPVVVSTDQDHDESATHGDAQAYQKPAGFKVLRGDAQAYEPTSNGGGARVPRSRGRGRGRSRVQH